MTSPMTRSRSLRARSGSVTASPSPLSASLSPSTKSSSTSLSSMDSDVEPKSAPLLDTYGNEFVIPDFTIKQIRESVPAHCFKRSPLRGYAYILRDIVLIISNFYLFNNVVVPALSNPIARFAAWGVYAFLQGLFGTGLWVIAHECGHQAFSSSKILNDCTGWVLHSALLVPYFSWKISHGKHHKATGNLERDMVFVPKSREEYSRRQTGSLAHDVSELLEETPIKTACDLLLQQLFGWPMYLLTNVTGHNYHSRQPEGRGAGKQNGYFGGVNHFNPSSPLYEAKDAKLILLSDIGLASTLTALWFVAQSFGWANVAVWYFVPYLWVNHWLVAITFLQHTDPTLPHYHPEAWNFARGAAATIDREFGFIGRHLFHGIIETHVAHHYISTIPFYNADEATEGIKKVMGRHYRSDTRDGALGFIKSLWRSARMCQWVEESEGATGEGEKVVFFRNRNGLGVKPKGKGQASVWQKERKNLVSVGVREVASEEE